MTTLAQILNNEARRKFQERYPEVSDRLDDFYKVLNDLFDCYESDKSKQWSVTWESAWDAAADLLTDVDRERKGWG